MKKVFLVFIATFLLLVTFSMSPALANASSTESDQNPALSGVINLNNLEELEKTGQVTVRELTYEEFLEDRAKEYGLSLEETRELYAEDASSKSASSFGTTAAGCSGDYIIQEINIEQVVRTFYRPAVQVFTCTYKVGSFRSFKYIQQVALDRNGINNSYSAKQFQGSVTAEILSDSDLWWSINGDFWDNGTTTYTGGVGGTTKVKGHEVTGNFSISYQSNHYEYWEDDGTYSLY